MTPKLMTLAAVVVLTVVFLSPVAYMAGQRATAVADRARRGRRTVRGRAWTRRSADTGPTERAKPPVRPGFGDI